jgi:pilus assembly protein Flp/PilA
MKKLLRFLSEEEAATAVEYAVMLAMIIMACIGAIATVGQQTARLWADNSSGLSSAFNNP